MDGPQRLKHFLDILYRRRWHVVVPLVLSLVGSYVILGRLPKVYRATTTILVLRQRMPEEFLKSAVAVPVTERIQSIEVQILSRTFLETVARDLRLLSPDASETEAEVVWQGLARKVSLDYDRKNLSWFGISVEDENPKLAAAIANRLASLFIERSRKVQEERAEEVVEIFDTWRAQREAELREKERRIAAFREKHLFELPEREAATLQLLQAARQRLDQLESDLSLKRERLAAVAAEQRARTPSSEAAGASPSGEATDPRTLRELEEELASLRATYTEEHPLVRSKRRQVEDLRRRLASAPAAPRDEASLAELPPDLSSPELLRLQAEIRRLEGEKSREQANVDELRARLANMPRNQQELANLMRDYETLKKQYEADLARREEASRGRDLVASNRGEQFQIQDPAREPISPVRPRPEQIALLGLLVGLGAGIGLVALAEFFDVSVRSEEELAVSFPELSVLAVIPNLDEEKKRGRSRPSGAKKTGRAALLLVLAVGWGGFLP